MTVYDHKKYSDSQAQTAINNDIDHSSTAPHSHNDLSGLKSGIHQTLNAQLMKLSFLQDTEIMLYRDQLSGAIPFFFKEVPSETIINENTVDTTNNQLEYGGSNITSVQHSFETDQNGWSVTNGTWTRSTDIADDGSYSMKTTDGQNVYCKLEQDFDLTDIDILRVWVYVVTYGMDATVYIDGISVASDSSTSAANSSVLEADVSGYTGTHTVAIECMSDPGNNYHHYVDNFRLIRYPKTTFNIDSNSPTEGMILATMTESDLDTNIFIQAFDDSDNTVDFTTLDTSVDLSTLNLLKLEVKMTSLASAIDNLGIVWS